MLENFEGDTQVACGDLVVSNAVLRSAYLPGCSVPKKDTPKTLHMIVATKKMPKAIIIGITQKPIDLTRLKSGEQSLRILGLAFRHVNTLTNRSILIGCACCPASCKYRLATERDTISASIKAAVAYVSSNNFHSPDLKGCWFVMNTPGDNYRGQADEK